MRSSGPAPNPAISCGVYRYPWGEGVRLALTTARDHLAGAGGRLDRATSVLFSAGMLGAFEEALGALS